MYWKQIVLVIVGVFALAAGLSSVASAESGGVGSRVESAVATSDPAAACATNGATPGLSQLCALWQGSTLPERAKEMIGSVIVRLAAQGTGNGNAGGDNADNAARPERGLGVCLRILGGENVDAPANLVERCKNLDARALHRICERAEQAGTVPPALAERCANLDQQGEPPARERIAAQCKEFLVQHPDARGERAAFCQRVVAGALTAADLKRLEQGPGREGREQQVKPQRPEERREAKPGATRDATPKPRATSVDAATDFGSAA